MWMLLVGAALAQSDGAYPVCDPTQADVPCDLDPSWSPLEAQRDEGRALGTEADPTPDVLPEPWRPFESYAFLEPGVVPGVRPAAPLGLDWGATVPFRPVVMPDALGDAEMGNPLKPMDWSGTPTVQIVVPLGGPSDDEPPTTDGGLTIERESEIGSE